jgi:UDP-glucose 4-epimerase
MASGNRSANGRCVMVTGGAGFIGSHLVDALIARGIRVRVLDNFTTGRREYLNPRAELVDADVRDPAAIRPAFDGVGCIFHLAARPRVMFSIEHPLDAHLSNVVGTLNVLIAGRDTGVRRFIFSGSSSVYGNQPTMPLHEAMTPNPLNPYALQKLTGEHYARLFHRLYGMETLTLRYFIVYGPRMSVEGAYVTVLGVFLDQRRRGQPLTIHGDGRQRRDFTHVRDAVRANLLAMDCAIADGRALNIGRGRNLSVIEIAAMIGGPTIHLERRPGDPQDTLADITQAREVLGWTPEVATEDGLRELIAGSERG